MEASYAKLPSGRLSAREVRKDPGHRGHDMERLGSVVSAAAPGRAVVVRIDPGDVRIVSNCVQVEPQATETHRQELHPDRKDNPSGPRLRHAAVDVKRRAFSENGDPVAPASESQPQASSTPPRRRIGPPTNDEILRQFLHASAGPPRMRVPSRTWTNATSVWSMSSAFCGEVGIAEGALPPEIVCATAVSAQQWHEFLDCVNERFAVNYREFQGYCRASFLRFLYAVVFASLFWSAFALLLNHGKESRLAVLFLLSVIILIAITEIYQYPRSCCEDLVSRFNDRLFLEHRLQARFVTYFSGRYGIEFCAVEHVMTPEVNQPQLPLDSHQHSCCTICCRFPGLLCSS